MLERVREALLHDPVCREVDPLRERERHTVDMELDWQAGAADLLDERIEAVEAGLRRQLCAFSLAAHDRQKTAHLRQRTATGVLDALERVTVLCQVIRQLVPHRS